MNGLFKKKNIQGDYLVSKVNYNRDYIISDNTADELNVYRTFTPFYTFNDVYAVTYDDNGKEIPISSSGPGTPGVRSLFNKMGALVLGSSDGSLDVNVSGGGQDSVSEWRVSNNVPLMDSENARMRIRKNSGCSIKELIKASEEGLLGRETYSYSDFMYCKYLGRMSNNYMITLRRFPIPVDDYIATMGENKSTRKDKSVSSHNVQSIGCMVTWLGTPGNEMNNILKYSFAMPFKEQQAQWQENSAGADSVNGVAPGLAAIFDPVYRQQYMAGQAGDAANGFFSKLFKVNPGNVPYRADEINAFKDMNKVYGPVDAIKSTYMRDDKGLTFAQSFSLTFDYELRSYNGINGRQAFLDLIANILAITYTTGTFWGGGYRGGGAHQNNIFSNLQIYKVRGGASAFYDAICKDVSNIASSFSNTLNTKYNGSIRSMIGSFLNDLSGMMIGAVLNKFGRPAKIMMSSLLSPAPVGFWHVTIGNPHHPIMSIGNMILKNTTIEHYGPLGLDDFPTGIRVVCEMERGKPRDSRDIEKLYMHGNDRIYSSMGPKIFDMYKSSKEYRGSQTGGKTHETDNGGVDNKISEYTGGLVKPSELRGLNNVLQKYFGHTDAYSIYVAAAEQEYGSSKKLSKTASGNSGRGRSGFGNTIG